MFIGSIPCDQHGNPLSQIINGSDSTDLSSNIRINFTFSHKPRDGHDKRPYRDYYEKVVAYFRILSHFAEAIDPDCRKNRCLA